MTAAATRRKSPSALGEGRGEGQPILEAKGIVNRFGKQTVHDGVDLEVKRGEILGIAGGSGSGKSVLMRTLAGLRHPDGGEVTIEGRPVESIHDGEKAALIGVLFQQGALFSSLSVAQNVMLPLREHTRLKEADRETIASMKLELAGLEAKDGAKFPSELSGGMVKRAALARALALDPRILFLDEPTSGLDPLVASGIDELIVDLNHALGVTVVVVTHDLNTIFGVCDRVAVLSEGKATVGPVDELMRSKDPWIHEFLHGPRAQGAAAAEREDHGKR